MSTVPEEFVLAHIYDPNKAHEYYLRTRKLKGRKTGQTQDAASNRFGKGKPASGQRHVTDVRTQAQRLKELDDRVKSLKQRLDKLKKFLAELKRQLAVKNGVPQKKDAASKGKGAANGPSKLNAAEKKDARQRSKKYYEEHKDEKPTNEIDQLKQDIRKAEEAIARTKEQLKAHVENARRKTAQFAPASTGRQNS